MSYWRLHYHLVWATYQRLPLIDKSRERQIYGTILGKAKELGVIVHAIGNVLEHIHVAVSIPPKIAVADCIKHFKGASSRYVNVQPNVDGTFKWQEGYGALTFGDRAMEDAVAYVRNQTEHHRQNTVRAAFERMTEEDDGVQIVGMAADEERR
jgi:putative transposase